MENLFQTSHCMATTDMWKWSVFIFLRAIKKYELNSGQLIKILLQIRITYYAELYIAISVLALASTVSALLSINLD